MIDCKSASTCCKKKSSEQNAFFTGEQRSTGRWWLWPNIAKLGYSSVNFVDPGVKISGPILSWCASFTTAAAYTTGLCSEFTLVHIAPYNITWQHFIFTRYKCLRCGGFQCCKFTAKCSNDRILEIIQVLWSYGINLVAYFLISECIYARESSKSHLSFISYPPIRATKNRLYGP